MNKRYIHLAAQLYRIRRVLAVKAVLIGSCGVVAGCNAPQAFASGITTLLWIGCEAFNEFTVKRISDELDRIQRGDRGQSESEDPS